MTRAGPARSRVPTGNLIFDRSGTVRAPRWQDLGGDFAALALAGRGSAAG